MNRTLIPFLLVAVAALATRSALGVERVIPLSEVRPGMKGFGLTVFEGTEPERFDVEVVSVVPNFMLRQSVILIRCSHPVTDRAGVIGGMSGSPIYLEGRLAGALAYGWRFHKDPIAGVTPIENMLDVLERGVRKPASRIPLRLARVLEPLFRAGAAREAPAPGSFFATFARRSDAGILPAHTPLALSGFSGVGRQMIEETLAPFDMDPVLGGGGGVEGGAGGFVAGGAIGVQLIRGDMSAAGIGTVTTVSGKDVLAFGHPMFNMGEGFLPVTTARIHTVIASLNRSNKLGSPLRVAGSLVQDRQACIAARTDREAPMIPVTIGINDARAGRSDEYHLEIASHRLLTARFLHAALVNVIQDFASDAEDVSAEITGVMKIAGKDPVTLHDSGVSRTGLAPLAAYFRPSGVVAAVLSNPFEDARIESLRFDVELRYGLEHSTVIGAYITAENPAPGDVINLNVRLRSYGGGESILTVPVRIPLTAGGEKLTLTVGGGDAISPVMAAPRTLDEMIENVKLFYPPKSLVVVLEIPGEGVSVRGHVLEQLPEFAVSAIKPATGSDETVSQRASARTIHQVSHVVVGKESVTFTVGNRRTR